MPNRKQAGKRLGEFRRDSNAVNPGDGLRWDTLLDIVIQGKTVSKRKQSSKIEKDLRIPAGVRKHR